MSTTDASPSGSRVDGHSSSVDTVLEEVIATRE